jgi:hypothetical protein
MPPKTEQKEYVTMLSSKCLEKYGGMVVLVGSTKDGKSGTSYCPLSVAKEGVVASLLSLPTAINNDEWVPVLAVADHLLAKKKITKEEYAIMTRQNPSANRSKPHPSTAPFFRSGPIILTPSGSKDGMKCHVMLGLPSKPGQPYVKTFAGAAMHDLIEAIYNSTCAYLDSHEEVKRKILLKSSFVGAELAEKMTLPGNKIISNPISYDYDDKGALMTHIPPSFGIKPMISAYSAEKKWETQGVFKYNTRPSDNGGDESIFWMKTLVEYIGPDGKYAEMGYATKIEDLFYAMYAGKEHTGKTNFEIGPKSWFYMRMDPSSILLPSLFISKDKMPSLKFSCNAMTIIKTVACGGGERQEEHKKAVNAKIAAARDADYGDGDEEEEEGEGVEGQIDNPVQARNEEEEEEEGEPKSNDPGSPLSPNPKFNNSNNDPASHRGDDDPKSGQKRPPPKDDRHHDQQGPSKKSRQGHQKSKTK